jgi:hypothetical protein
MPTLPESGYGVRPANQQEELPASALLLQLGRHYPGLNVDAMAGDAGYGEVSYNPPDCPYQHNDHTHCRIVNLAEHFPDSSIRMMRDLPVGGLTWKKRYHSQAFRGVLNRLLFCFSKIITAKLTTADMS